MPRFSKRGGEDGAQKEEMIKMEKTIFDRYLIDGERLIRLTKKAEVNLAVSNKRLIILDEKESKFEDIRFGNIVSVAWQYTSNLRYLVYFVLSLIGGVILYSILPEEATFISVILFLVSIGFLIAYFVTKKCYLSIITKDGNVHRYTFGGAGVKDDMRDICMDIRNADEEYTPKG